MADPPDGVPTFDDSDFTEPAVGGDGVTDLQSDEVTIAGEDVDCRNCIHFEVCAFFAGIQPMLAQEEDAPIEATDLAVICDAFEQ